MPKRNEKWETFLAIAQDMYGEEITAKEANALLETTGLVANTAAIYYHLRKRKVRRGVYALTDTPTETKAPKRVATKKKCVRNESVANIPVAKSKGTLAHEQDYRVSVDPLFVSPGGWATKVKKILKSKTFNPLYISGETGTGKTYAVKQLAAQLKREIIRVAITTETGESDLIGGYRLVNGETVWQDGPAIVAMKRGAILLLDEIDLASSKIMCLQAILEGDEYYIKKENELVLPHPEFTIVATANTKGDGDGGDRFMFTGPLNAAFLERFYGTFDVGFMSEKTESDVLFRLADEVNAPKEDLDKVVKNLIAWANEVRSSFSLGTLTETISTRRLAHIMRMYAIFKKLKPAIEICINRYNERTQKNMMDAYAVQAVYIPGHDEEETEELF